MIYQAYKGNATEGNLNVALSEKVLAGLRRATAYTKALSPAKSLRSSDARKSVGLQYGRPSEKYDHVQRP